MGLKELKSDCRCFIRSATLSRATNKTEHRLFLPSRTSPPAPLLYLRRGARGEVFHAGHKAKKTQLPATKRITVFPELSLPEPGKPLLYSVSSPAFSFRNA